MVKFHFISGLPRSGSTLLSAILKQNPRFHAGHSSPVYGICDQISAFISRSEHHAYLSNDTRRNVYRAVFDGYYKDKIDSKIKCTVFDTNRAWSAKMDLLRDIFGEVKIICCVRPVVEIVQSIENIIARSPSISNLIVDPKTGVSVYGRVDSMMASGGIIGNAISCLKGGFFEVQSKNLMLVRYETICKDPASTLEKIYDFLSEKSFNHDFDNLEFSSEAFDSFLGIPELHLVRKKVDYREASIHLPPDLVARLEGSDFWKRSPVGSDATII